MTAPSYSEPGREVLIEQLNGVNKAYSRAMDALTFLARHVEDSYGNGDDSVPEHDCEYHTAPDKGACTFCSGWAEVRDTLGWDDQ